MRKEKTLADRFWAKVNKNGPLVSPYVVEFYRDEKEKIMFDDTLEDVHQELSDLSLFEQSLIADEGEAMDYPSVPELLVDDAVELTENDEEVVLHGTRCIVLASSKDYSKRELREYYGQVKENLEVLVEAALKDFEDTKQVVEVAEADINYGYVVFDLTWKRTLVWDSFAGGTLMEATGKEATVFSTKTAADAAIHATKSRKGYAWVDNEYIVVSLVPKKEF